MALHHFQSFEGMSQGLEVLAFDFLDVGEVVEAGGEEDRVDVMDGA